ncbi:MAG: Lrp/AsnC ligand binding domain-containing protein [Actinomycetota bacterium]
MIEAYVLIQTKIGKLESAASEASRITRVASAAVIAGPYDMIVRVVAEDVDSLGRLVVSKIQAIDGVTRTLTCPTLHL